MAACPPSARIVSETGLILDSLQDAPTRPSVVLVAATPADATLGVGAMVTFTVQFTEAVFVTGGIPALRLNDGGRALFAGGSGTDTLTFAYVVAAGRNVADLQATGIGLRGARVRNAAGRNADLAGAAADPEGVLAIDTIAPTITAIEASPDSAALRAGAVVTFTVRFSEAVTVSGGTPALVLNSGGRAQYVGGSGTDILTFSYFIQAGDNAADLQVLSLARGPAAIRDAAGNAARLSGAAGFDPAGTLVVDTARPTITGIVATPADASLRAGGTVTLTVQLSEAVTISTGSPVLHLNDGGTAHYAGGSGTDALTFVHVIAPGQNAADLQVLSLRAPLASIHDSAGNVLDRAGAIGFDPAGTLAVDTDAPVLTMDAPSGDGMLNLADSAAGLAVSGTAGGLPDGSLVTIDLRDAGDAVLASATASVSAGAWSTQFPAAIAQGLADGDYSLSADATDIAGNMAIRVAGGLAVDMTPPGAAAILSAGIVAGDWDLAGTAEPGSTVMLRDGVILLDTVAADSGGAWSAAGVAGADAIRRFTASVTDAAGNAGPASAPWVEGTGEADVLAFADRAALLSAARIDGRADADRLQLDSAANLADADFTAVVETETLALTGASSAALGTHAAVAGIQAVLTGNGDTMLTAATPLAIDAAALGESALLTLAGSATLTVTGLAGSLAAGDLSGPLDIVAGDATGNAIAIATGTASTTIQASGTGDIVAIDASALASGATLMLSGAVGFTVTDLVAILSAGGSTGALEVIAGDAADDAIALTTGSGAVTITASGTGDLVAIDAAAMADDALLTLSGAAAMQVTGLAADLAAGNLAARSTPRRSPPARCSH